MIDYTRQAEAARPDTLADVQHRLSVALEACNELARVCAAGVLSQQETQAEADKLRNAFETASDSRTLWKTRALAAFDDRYVTDTTFTGEVPMEGGPWPQEGSIWQPRGTMPQVVGAALSWMLKFGRHGTDAEIGRIREGLMAYLDDWAAQIRKEANEATAAKMGNAHRPRRDSDVDLWIKKHRDAIGTAPGRRPVAWYVIDEMLNDYRDHADEGTPLDRPVQGPHPE